MEEPMADPITPQDGAPVGDPPAPNWRDTLPETLKGNETLSQFDSIDKLAEAFVQKSVEPEFKPEDYELPEDSQGFAKFAAEQKLSKSQVEALVKLNMSSTEAVDAQYTEGLKKLEEGEWQGTFKENIALAKKALNHFDKSGEVVKMLEATRAGNHPAVVKFLYEIGAQLGEDVFVKGGGRNGGAPRSAAEVMYGKN
jgi:hypothetical protein